MTRTRRHPLGRPPRCGHGSERNADGNPSVQNRRVTRSGVVVAGLLLAVGSAQGYRFFERSDWPRDRRILRAEDALRWSPEVWCPGETLVWEIAPHPDFEALFDSPEGFRPFLERAALAWSAVPTADISWRIAGIGEATEDGDPSKDQRNRVLMDADAPQAYGRVWSERSSNGIWPIHECDVGLSSRFARLPEDLEPEAKPGYREREREVAVNVLVHEMGHCLGLAHSGAMSFLHGWRHRRDPVMSYGYTRGLFQDDIVGASLLRPAAGWQESTGSVSGILQLAGEPIPHAQVWALPAGAQALEDRIGAFSDASGEFHLEGLAPGHYALWVQPIHQLDAHRRLAPEPPPDLDETVSGGLVRVVAGSAVEGVEITLRQGRTVRSPGQRPSERGRDRANSIVGRWGTPCSGIRVPAQHPSSSVGPLRFARRFPRLLEGRLFGTSLTVEWGSRAARTVFDWTGIYRDWWGGEDEEGRERVQYIHGLEGWSTRRGSTLDVSVDSHRISNAGSVTRHELAMEWPESATATLRFRSADGACRGEPTVVCDLKGCELRR